MTPQLFPREPRRMKQTVKPMHIFAPAGAKSCKARAEKRSERIGQRY